MTVIETLGAYVVANHLDGRAGLDADTQHFSSLRTLSGMVESLCGKRYVAAA